MLNEKFNPKDFEDELYENGRKMDILNQVWIRQKKVIAL